MRSCPSPWAGTDFTPKQRSEKLLPHRTENRSLIKCVLFGCLAAFDPFQSLKQSSSTLQSGEGGNQEEKSRWSRNQRILQITSIRGATNTAECSTGSKHPPPSLRSASSSTGKTHSGLTCFTPWEFNIWTPFCCIWNNPKDSLKPFKIQNTHFLPLAERIQMCNFSSS